MEWKVETLRCVGTTTEPVRWWRIERSAEATVYKFWRDERVTASVRFRDAKTPEARRVFTDPDEAKNWAAAVMALET